MTAGKPVREMTREEQQALFADLASIPSEQKTIKDWRQLMDLAAFQVRDLDDRRLEKPRLPVVDPKDVACDRTIRVSKPRTSVDVERDWLRGIAAKHGVPFDSLLCPPSKRKHV